MALLSLSLGGCALLGSSTQNLDYRADRPHHRPGGFANRYDSGEEKGDFWKWQRERKELGLPKPPDAPVTGVAPEVDYLQSNRQETSATWIGHSTVLLQLDGLNILTDPHWGRRASPVRFAGPKRHQPPGVAFEDLPPIDIVLISHNHYDHLDLVTVRRLMKRHAGRTRFYVPLGVQHWFARHVPGAVMQGEGQNVFALDWDESIAHPGTSAPLELRFLAVQHWSSRTLWDRNATLWGSWAVLHPRFRFWFSGDLGYSQDTQDIGKQFPQGFDLAAIAIGAYEPRWFMRRMHINPEEAVQVMQDIGARQALGIHWGTFEGLTDESLDQPPRDLAKARAARGLSEADFFVLRHGQTRRYPSPAPEVSGVSVSSAGWRASPAEPPVAAGEQAPPVVARQ